MSWCKRQRADKPHTLTATPESAGNLLSMSADCERQPEYLEESTSDTERNMQTLHRRTPYPSFFLRGNSANHCSTVHHYFRVKYSREAHEDRGVRQQSEVEPQHPRAGLPEADEHSQRKRPAVRRSCFRVFKVSLGVLYVLILAGITTRYISVSLEKQQLQIKYDQLSNNYSELQVRHSVKCPGEWLKFGQSCYFKSTERKTWPESRRDCQNKGADLVIINSREEQEFISELNMKEESWIGLKTTYEEKTGEHEWEWVDGSPLTEAFWAPEQQGPSHGFSAVCCEADGKWTQSRSQGSQIWICEK